MGEVFGSNPDLSNGFIFSTDIQQLASYESFEFPLLKVLEALKMYVPSIRRKDFWIITYFIHPRLSFYSIFSS